MPNINDTVTYTSTIGPSGATAPVSYSWVLNDGGNFTGVTTSSSCQIIWTSAGTYTLSCTASNSCNSVTSHFQVAVTQPLYSYTHTQTECGNFTRDNCGGGCTPSSATYCRDATETRDSTISQAQAVTNAVAAATFSAQQLVQAGGQAFANANATCNNCPCTEVWTDNGVVSCGQNIGVGYNVCKQYKQQTNQCNSNTQWIEQGDNNACPGCTQPCNISIAVNYTNNGIDYNVVTTSSGGNGVIELSQNGGANYGPMAAGTLGAGTYTFCVREQANTACSACQTFTLNTICNPNNWTNTGTQYCNGVDLVQNQINDCGGNRVFTVQANSPSCCTSNWVDDGINFTCGQNIGQDACKVYKQQIDGCGNTRWVFSNDNTGCGGCCQPPVVGNTSLAYSSVIAISGGNRVIALGNYTTEGINVEINLSGNSTTTFIPANMVLGTTNDWILPLIWIYTPGETAVLKFWFASDPDTCNFTGTSTVV